MLKNGWLTLVLCIAMMASVQAQTITFGVVPQQAAHKLAEAWGPILEYVSKKTGHELKFETAPSIPEFEARCAAGDYDVAYMNPYHYTVFSQKPGYLAFANQANKKIQGILVVRKDSSLTRLEQLSGQALAFPAPAAFAASVLPRAHLSSSQIEFKPKFVFSHDAVYKAVAAGEFVAGGGIQRTFNKVAPSVRDQLKILWTSDRYTPHAIAAHPRLDPDVVAVLQQALVTLHESPEGQSLLKPIGFSAVQTAADSDWDDVRALDIQVLERLVKG